MTPVCIDVTTLEIVVLSGLLWLPLGVIVGGIAEHWRGHVRKSDEWRGRQG